MFLKIKGGDHDHDFIFKGTQSRLKFLFGNI